MPEFLDNRYSSLASRTARSLLAAGEFGDLFRVLVFEGFVSRQQLRNPYDTTAKRWAIVVPETDTANAATKVLTSVESGWLGEWTHLGMVYDATRAGQPGTLRLYVNGVLVGHRPGVRMVASDGPFTVGRGKWNGAHMGFFPGGVDDVRVFSRALGDGEVRLVHDSAGWATLGSWRFDAGSGRDYTGRTDASLAQPGVTFTPGVSGVGLQMDGVNGGAATTLHGPSMRDSFTVSAWARLSRSDRVATVLGQDGSRMSGFVVQYRPELGRWVFGSRASDSDGAALTYAASAQPAVLNEWTHLAGVYDRAAQQLRLYVDGQLAGTRNHLPLWAASGGFTIGRGKVNGARAEFFPGAVDEARVDLGMVPDSEIARRAVWPEPVAGILGVFVDGAGDRYTAATDPETGETGARKVTATITTQGHKDLMEFTLWDGTRAVATTNHPFWVEGKWIDAGDLLAGDTLQGARRAHVEATVQAVRQTASYRRVHNLTVEGIHTYHVVIGDFAALVHNDDPWDFTIAGDYTGRVDRFTHRGSARFEIHVYHKGVEVGIYGRSGWMGKHGHSADVKLSSTVKNRLKGIAVDELRRAGRIKPGDDVKGNAWKRSHAGEGTGC